MHAPACLLKIVTLHVHARENTHARLYSHLLCVWHFCSKHSQATYLLDQFADAKQADASTLYSTPEVVAAVAAAAVVVLTRSLVRSLPPRQARVAYATSAMVCLAGAGACILAASEVIWEDLTKGPGV